MPSSLSNLAGRLLGAKFGRARLALELLSLSPEGIRLRISPDTNVGRHVTCSVFVNTQLIHYIDSRQTETCGCSEPESALDYFCRIPLAFLDGAGRQLRVVVRQGPRKAVLRRRLRLHRQGLEANVECLSLYGLRGWVYDTAEPARRLPLFLEINGERALSFENDIPRTDVARKRKVSGVRGFEADVPLACCRDFPNVLSLVAETKDGEVCLAQLAVKENIRFIKARHGLPGDTGPRGLGGKNLSLLGLAACETPGDMEPKQEYDVVVPVFNGYDYLASLLPRVLANTPQPYRLILVDDGSDDPRVAACLDEFASRHDHVQLIRFPENRGFVAAVNAGLQAGRNHVAILNLDTEVPPGWLQRLMRPIARNPFVASATPFTNAGTICSFPVFLEDNELFENLPVEHIDARFQALSLDPGLCTTELPTGVGFCMGMNRRAIEALGLFDESYGRGYCEENAWCRKAVKHGYSNVIVENLFVYHKHGGTFSAEEKRQAYEANMKTLCAQHPEYSDAVHCYIRENPLAMVRDFVLLCLASDAAGPLTLFVTGARTGGAAMYLQGRLGELVRAGAPCLVAGLQGGKELDLEFHYKGHASRMSLSALASLSRFRHLLRIKEIVVNDLHAAGESPFRHMEQLAGLKSDYGARLRYCLHDYQALCPSYKLLDGAGRFCGLACLETPNIVANCAAGFSTRTRITDMGLQWRAPWALFLEQCDEVRCFSRASRELLLRVFPNLSPDTATCVPHRVDYLAPLPDAGRQAPQGGATTVAVIGALDASKGCDVLAAMARIVRDEALPLRLLLVGHSTRDEELRELGVEVTGRYDREDLPRLLQKRGADICFIPSIWPETFSYTAEECMRLGMPAASFDVGAPPERLREYEQGHVIAPLDARAAVDFFVNWRRERPV